jgi:hypothetical protein
MVGYRLFRASAGCVRFFSVYFFIFILVSLSSPTVRADDKEPPYRRAEIANARFGEDSRRELLKKAYGLKQQLAEIIVGQDRLGQAMQDRLVQYLEGFGSRTKDPIALHMIGLPGVGKSASLAVLEKMGVRVLRVDAQNFAGLGAQNAIYNLFNSLQIAVGDAKTKKVPLIVLFDEIDKIAEVTKQGNLFQETTSPLIGFLNQILNDGKVSHPNNANLNLDLSNTFVVTAMNFSPDEIERFSQEALGAEKNFYDYTIEDFARFDQWLRNEPSAIPKVLSHLFRSNTVSRFAPNTVIAKPLDLNDYKMITLKNVNDAIAAATRGDLAAKKLTVTTTDNFIEFLAKNVTYAPLGARENVIKANFLTEQLINFGGRAIGPADISLTQPRQIEFDYNESKGTVQIRITPRYRVNRETVAGEPFYLDVAFDSTARAFIYPENLAQAPPPQTLRPPVDPTEKPFTKKEILAARFPKLNADIKGLAARIDEDLIGQEFYTRIIEADLIAFTSRSGPVEKNPPFRIIAGFPGIGKSELINLAGKYSGIPVARINMQAFSANDSKTLIDFINTLEDAIVRARLNRKDGKFILLIEELDKVFEINPQTGLFVDRPVMNFIKDLLNDGFIRVSLGDGVSRTSRFVDIRDSYPVVTMNFAVDRFGFVADPRLTSIEDVYKAWEMLKTRPADLKSLLGSMFLPETVSRMLPRVLIMQPLQKSDYQTIITNQVQGVIESRLYDPKTGRNHGQIEVKLTPDYRRYLYRESVIPSEGARNTVIVSQQRIATDLEDALSRIPKSSKFAAVPLDITLDFKEGSETVVASARPKNGSFAGEEIYRRKVELTFPSLKAKGRMTETRVMVAIHEFGHAYVGIRHGRRIEYMSVVPPFNGAGGYVKFRNDGSLPTAKSIVARVYSLVASRAMERMFLSENPLDSRSVLDITSGASNDIVKATKELWELLHELGMNPDGGTLDRRGVDGPSRYASFADLPNSEIQLLAQTLRKAENYILQDLLNAHSRAWYVEKIGIVARKGGLDEKEFYEVIGYPYPGDNSVSFGENSLLYSSFVKILKTKPAEINIAFNYKQGDTQTTATQNLDAATRAFSDFLSQTATAENSTLVCIRSLLATN